MNINFKPHLGRTGLCWMLVCTALLATLPSTYQLAQIGNSTRKIRVRANSTSQKVGSAVNWQADFNTAIAQSKQTGKPVFWYIPTLPDTFMDRKTEIHRYMLAGPFSWPAIIKTLNENAICLKAPPTKQQQQRFGLSTYKFVEPGFVILNSDGTKTSQVDQLTTLQPIWLNQLIQKSLGLPNGDKLYSETARLPWNLLADQQFASAAIQAKQTLNQPDLSDDQRAELELLLGMAIFRTGQHQQAIDIWKTAAQRYPNQPLAWKAAAESQLIGPFARGFETHSKLPPAAMAAGTASRGSTSPQNVYTQPQLQFRSAQFLLAMQRRDGSFRDSDYDFGGTDSLPNVHVAVTSLAGQALLAQYENLSDVSPEFKKQLADSVAAAAKFVSDDGNLNKRDQDEILWACAFRLRFLTACLRSTAPQIKAVLPSDQITRIIASLETIQTRRGNWYHEYSNPFATGTALLALTEAARSGHTVNSNRIEKGSAALASQRFRDGVFPYQSGGDNRTRTANRPTKMASAGRRPLCELALFHTGKSDNQKLVAAIEASFAHHAAMAKAYKYDDHTDNLNYGGFFFWYDMRSRCEAIQHVADDRQRSQFVAQQLALIMAIPEIDGCFVDSHELGRSYATSMALICFDLLNRSQ